ncbi:hypothetical protein MY5147_006191 [Beauveria neobassiana]
MPIDQSRPDAPRPHPDPNQGREPTAGELECYQNDDASLSGMQRNVAKASGNHPDDPMFEQGCGNVPPDQPGNHIGVPHDDPGTQSPSSANPETVTALPGAPGQYAQVPTMKAYDPITAPSQDAQTSAVNCYKRLESASPKLVADFKRYFHDWQETWSGHFSSSAEDRCYTSEFDKLVEMGKEILPLVNYILLNDENFTAVFLYNALEDDTRYRVDPHDVLNFLTLQRQQNLIVDLNRDRKW